MSTVDALEYDAYILFAVEDRPLAMALYDALEQVYRRSRRSFNVFFDATLVRDVRHVLTTLSASGNLIVITSPFAAASEFVRHALDWWRTHRGLEGVLPVLADGPMDELFPGLMSLEYVDFRGLLPSEFVLSNHQFAGGVEHIKSFLHPFIKAMPAQTSSSRRPNSYSPFDETVAIPPLSSPPPRDSSRVAAAVLVRVFYGTDRALTGKPDPNVFYADDRSTTDNPFTLGVCEVSIPTSDAHRLGGLEGPSVFSFEFSEDTTKHVVLSKVSPLPLAAFFAELRSRVARSARNEAFVFVHGYNISFRDAARRTAQLAYDLSFDGAPILFSWPSRARWWLYSADETIVEWSVPHLEAFLAGIASTSGARTIHLIAHSMGNRCLTKALELIVAKRSVTPATFRHIVLTAPDIDERTFLDLARVITPAGERITFYANHRDRALLLSKLFHVYRRAGASIMILPGVDTIDASGVDTSLVRHSYFGTSRTVLADLAALLIDGRAPDKRFGMREAKSAQGTYYQFRP